MHSLLTDMQQQTRLWLGLLLFSLLSASPVWADSKQSKLNEVRSEINRTEKQIRQARQQIRQHQQFLRKSEVKIAKLATEQRKTETRLRSNRTEIAKLEQQRQVLLAQKQSQQQLLEQQLLSAYLSGEHDYLKMLFNQQSAAKLERTLAYYQFFNDARIEAIDALEQTLAELKVVDDALSERRQELEQLLAQQQREAEQLQAEDARREEAVSELRQLMREGNVQLAQLRESEEALHQLIEQVKRRAEPSMRGLRPHKGKLKWPVKGTISRAFGSSRQAGITWKGVLLDAPEGAQVSAIEDGIVVFSDWVKGFGMLLVVDHGEGYLSIYGHNQALLKRVGDKVALGEPIALVGRSGGQLSSGLYFELRHQGDALNPAAWCKRS